MPLHKFKKADFKYNCTFVNLQLSYHLYELLFFFEAFKNLPLVKCNCNDALPFCLKNFLILFYDISSIFRLLYSLSSLIQFFYFDDIVYRYGLYQLLFYFVFVKTFHLFVGFRVSPPLKTKNNHYTIYLKHPLQTKMQLRWAQNVFFST